MKTNHRGVIGLQYISGMDLNDIKCFCKDLGKIKNLNINHEVFGNMDIEIITPKGTKLYIVSDRGEFSCYLKKNRALFERLVPINKVLNISEAIVFESLDDMINYLKSNIYIIEKNIKIL